MQALELLAATAGRSARSSRRRVSYIRSSQSGCSTSPPPCADFQRVRFYMPSQRRVTFGIILL